MASLTNGRRHFMRLFGTFRRKKTCRQEQFILPTAFILGHRPFAGHLRDTLFVCWTWRSMALLSCPHEEFLVVTFITINLITKTNWAHQASANGMLCHDYILSTQVLYFIHLILSLLSHISTLRYFLIASVKNQYVSGNNKKQIYLYIHIPTYVLVYMRWLVD